MIYCVILQRRDDVKYLLSLGFMNFICWCSSCKFLREGAWQFIFVDHHEIYIRPKKNKKKINKLCNFCKRQSTVFFGKEYFIDDDDDDDYDGINDDDDDNDND